MSKLNKFGFTLAEVLITLGVIGIVAAMTIPTIFAKVDHARKISYLKKAHSVLNQAVRLSSEDNGDYASWNRDLSTREYLEIYWAPYMKIVVYCTSYTVCNYKNSTPWSRYSGNGDYTGFNVFSRIPIFTLDGILYSISMQGGVNSEPDTDAVYDFDYIGKNGIFIDVNGSNPPNRFGNDVFMFVGNSDGSIMPLGYNLSEDKLNNDCSKKGKCLYCAEKLRRNGWKSYTGYPW